MLLYQIILCCKILCLYMYFSHSYLIYLVILIPHVEYVSFIYQLAFPLIKIAEYMHDMKASTIDTLNQLQSSIFLHSFQ